MSPRRMLGHASRDLRDETGHRYGLHYESFPSRVEHVAEPAFLSIVGDKEVIVQLPEHIARESYAEVTAAKFDTPAVMWRGIMSTDGSFEAVWVNRATGEEVRRLAQRAGLSWFAFLPPRTSTDQAPVQLAVPGEPGRALRARPKPVVLGEHTSHDILVDLDAEYKGDLLSDPPTSESGVPTFHFNDGGNQRWIGPLRAWFPALFRRE